MATPGTDSLIGQLVDGRYLVRERVARGGMATVYRATDKRLDRSVALKIMHPHLAEGTGGQNFVARFRREARAAARVTHAGLVAVYDQGVDGEISYLTLEFVEGSDLRRLLENQGTLPLGQALAITEDILDALAAAHRNHLVHRDVKPENVLLSTENEVKITDFGLARAVTEVTSTTTGTILGTVAYLAPELVTTGVGDTRADIYSVGIMLYEMITGSQPFVGETPIHVAFQHVNYDVPSIRDSLDWIPESVDQLIHRFTARDPHLRPTHAGDALNYLRSVVTPLKAGLLAKRAVPPAPQPAVPSEDTRTGETRIVEASQANLNQSSSGSPATREFNPELENTAAMDLDDAILLEHDEATNYLAATPVPPVSSKNSESDVDALIHATRNSASTPTRTTPDDSVSSPWASSTSARSPRSANETIPLSTRNSGTTIALPLGPTAFPQAQLGSPESAVARTPNRAPAPAKTSPKRSKKRAAFLTIVFLLLAGGAGYGGWYWWDNIGPGSFVNVPQALVDIPKDESLAKFSNIELDTTVRETYDDNIAAGNVISTDPQSGERVKRESTVEIVVSLGVKNLEIPTKLTGKPQADATKSLTAAGFTNVEPDLQYDTQVKKGTVLAVSVKEGATVPHNTKIVLTVSNGPEPITIPQVITMQKDQAVAALKKEELKTKTKEVFHDSIEKGEVIEQSPAQGSNGHRGDTVTLTISKGREQVTVPNVVGMNTQEATDALQANGLVAKVDKYMGGLFDRVRFQGEKAGAKIDKGSQVTITIW